MNYNKDLSKQITFLLPLKDRDFISKRLIKYLNSIDFKLNIIVADGSLKSQENLFAELKKKHNLQFKKFPFDKDPFIFVKKLSESVENIRTEYCALMESDELINFETYFFFLDFLKNNLNYNFVTGKIVNFDLKKDKSIQIHQKQCHPDFDNLLKSKFEIENHPSCWEGLHRSYNLKKSLQNIFEVSDENFNMLVLVKFLNIFTLAQGDAKFFQSKLISFRQANTSLWDNDVSTSANKIMQQANKIKTFLFLKNIQYIFKMYLIVENLQNKNLKKMFIKYYGMHIINVICQDLQNFSIKLYTYIKKKIINKKIISDKNNKSINIDGTYIDGYNFLNIHEKNKIRDLINYFQI